MDRDGYDAAYEGSAGLDPQAPHWARTALFWWQLGQRCRELSLRLSPLRFAGVPRQRSRLPSGEDKKNRAFALLPF